MGSERESMASHGLGHRVAWQKGLDKGRLGIAACGNSAQENQVGKDQLGSEANFFIANGLCW